MSRVRLTIESLAARGEAVARHDGRVVFVRGAVPGDEVEVELPEGGAPSAHAELVKVLEPSTLRRDPGCPHFDSCGGCQWLHVDDAAQAEAKERLFYDALKRIGGIPRTRVQASRIIRSGAPLRYRHRAKVHLSKGRLGYAEAKSHLLVDLAECRLLEPRLERALMDLKAAAAELGAPAGTTDVSVASDARRVTAAFHGAKRLGERRAFDLMRKANLDGVVLAPEDAPAVLVGKTTLNYPAVRAEGVTVHGRADLFAQANFATNAALVGAALDYAGRPGRALELYCGAGNFTFGLAASGAQVVGVEFSGEALELAMRSAREAKVANVRFMRGDALKLADALAREGERFDVLLLDPPRAGAKGVGPLAERLGAKRVVYVSCDPATLARDAKDLEAHGFVARAATPVDMFPQTFHVEGVLLLERAHG